MDSPRIHFLLMRDQVNRQLPSLCKQLENGIKKKQQLFSEIGTQVA